MPDSTCLMLLRGRHFKNIVVFICHFYNAIKFDIMIYNAIKFDNETKNVMLSRYFNLVLKSADTCQALAVCGVKLLGNTPAHVRYWNIHTRRHTYRYIYIIPSIHGPM